MRRIGIALLLLFSIGLNPAAAEVVSRIAAVVNKDIITTNQLDQKLKEQLAKKGSQPSPAQLGALRQELLSRMIEETLMQQRIKALNLKATDEEVEKALLDVQKNNQLTREQLKEAVNLQGMDFEDYRENLRSQILRYKLLGEEVRSQVNVPEREVVEYYRAHLDDYRLPAEVQLSNITFPISNKASEQERQKIQEMANEALERLQRGEALDEVVKIYNKTYGATGGELGRFLYKDLVPGFADAIKGVAAGGFSRPVISADAIHLLRVDELQPARLRQFDTVKEEIYEKIMDQKIDARVKEWTKNLKARSFIDIRL
jgi:peptidyl-prolyl cis-trans isomerase SurA